MIQKIVSNGRPGVGRGAIEAALSLDIPHGGRPFSEMNKTDIPSHPSAANRCVEANAREADGTLILIFSPEMPEDGGTAKKVAERHHLPLLIIHLDTSDTFHASQAIHEWLKTHDIHVLHVAGSPNENGKKAEKTTQGLLEAVYYLGLIEKNMTAAEEESLQDHDLPPASIDNFVSRLLTELTLKDRVILANMKEESLGSLRASLGRHIELRLEKLGQAPSPPAFLSELETTKPPGEKALFIITLLWEKLKKSHKIRLVK